MRLAGGAGQAGSLTGRDGQVEKDKLRRTGRDGQAETDRQRRTGRDGQAETDRQRRTGRDGQVETNRYSVWKVDLCRASVYCLWGSVSASSF